MEKFKVGDRVSITNPYIGYDELKNEIGTVVAIRNTHNKYGVDLDKNWGSPFTPDIKGGTRGHYYIAAEEELSLVSSSPYSSLRARIEAINGSTTLQEFGELLLEVGEEKYYLAMPTSTESKGNFVIEDRMGSLSCRGGVLHKPCDAIPALKKCFMYLLDNHPTIKKDDKQEKIEALQKEQLELKAKLSILDHKIEELQK